MIDKENKNFISKKTRRNFLKYSNGCYKNISFWGYCILMEMESKKIKGNKKSIGGLRRTLKSKLWN